MRTNNQKNKPENKSASPRTGKRTRKRTSSQSLPALKKKVQMVFNEYIRLRDQGKPCIACGKKRELQAGHFFPVGRYDGLRFNEDNVHGECRACNYYDEAHLIYYSQNLLKKIGEERYEALKSAAAEYKKSGYKWSRAELLELLAKYKTKVNQLNQLNQLNQ